MLCGVEVPPIEAHQDDLQRRIAVICGHRNVADAALVAVIAEAIETGSWFMAGVKTPEHFVAWQTGSSDTRSRHLVAVARRRHDFPRCCTAFENGEISFDQITAIATHAPAWADTELADFARHATVTQLRHTLRNYHWHDDADANTADTASDANPAEPADADTGAGDTTSGDSTSGEHADEPITAVDDAAAAAEPNRGLTADPYTPWSKLQLPPQPVGCNRNPADYCSLTFTNGRFRLIVEGDAIDGAIIDASLREAHDRLHRDGHTDLTWVDALVDVANRSLGSVTNPERVDRYRTYIHLDTSGAWLNNGPTLPRSQFEHITCDSVTQPVWEREGHPVNIGRARHTIPNHTRRIILDRDVTCRHPGCNASRHLHVHHVIHWINGGPTDTHNLAALCPAHHRALHREQFTISGNADEPDGLTFTINGRPITTPHAQPPNSPPPEPPPGHRYAHPTGEHLDRRCVIFNEPRQTAA